MSPMLSAGASCTSTVSELSWVFSAIPVSTETLKFIAVTDADDEEWENLADCTTKSTHEANEIFAY